MSKMVVLPKIPLYIGWLVCVLVIPVGYENEKRARTRPPAGASLLLYANTTALMAQCFARRRKSRLQTAKWRYISRFATPVLAWTAAQRPVPSATAASRTPSPPTDNGGLVG